ncbi:isoleucine--tRNA ligase, chloroplastic/mitochondrial [Artemisia annua]|uniref:Isoleucine--tRNA ligase, chloroplastic/mitochondrial n=1 Tax=Artemisia annua TaxID=35608 RepID=A0A2U1KP19_ARTAN|nr:isoleucine--tRNA ligase, chloroplastic/mitochondrial [Artemisia annua]
MDVWFDFRYRSASGLVSKLFIDQRCNQRQSSIRWNITHGFVLDEKGLKMSRSLGKVVDPRTLIEGGKNQEVGDCFPLFSLGRTFLWSRFAQALGFNCRLYSRRVDWISISSPNIGHLQKTRNFAVLHDWEFMHYCIPEIAFMLVTLRVLQGGVVKQF